MSKRDDIKEELEKEEDEVYGDETAVGSAPDPEKVGDTEELVKEVTGNEPEEGKPYSIAEEVEKDEKEEEGN